ncbi:MAG: glycosyltransferase [Candidatus Gastranaerophilales bacterium]|nr:glycosyltransferase [Candidatus Gastranaerophilales bacterium]
MPKISIVVPVYNVEKYLKECIDSIINQTLQDIEIICVDDGSTDSSGEILDNYAANDTRVKVIHKKNTGYGNSMNTGFSKATGEYIGIVESDDFAELNMFENLYNTAKQFNADVVKSDWYNYYTADNNSTKQDFTSRFECNNLLSFKTAPEIFMVQGSIWSAIYKREFIEKNNIKFLETPGASYQDLSFTYKIFGLAENFVIVPDAYIHYRKDNDNSSVKSKNKAYIIFPEYEEVNKLFENNSELKAFANNQRRLHEYWDYYAHYYRIDDKFKAKFLKLCSEQFKVPYKNGEFSSEYFSQEQLDNIKLIVKNPMKLYRRTLNKLSFCETVFSIKNSNGNKIMTILGIKINLKKRKNNTEN